MVTVSLSGFAPRREEKTWKIFLIFSPMFTVDSCNRYLRVHDATCIHICISIYDCICICFAHQSCSARVQSWLGRNRRLRDSIRSALNSSLYSPNILMLTIWEACWCQSGLVFWRFSRRWASAQGRPPVSIVCFFIIVQRGRGWGGIEQLMVMPMTMQALLTTFPHTFQFIQDQTTVDSLQV